ncbi:uncharacterized protein LOC141661365 isoform X4 [Apium graveolens]
MLRFRFMFLLLLNKLSRICYEWGRRGSGAMFSLVSGMGGPNTAANVVTSGLFFALVQGGLFKLFVSSTSMPTCRKNFQRRSSSNFQGKEDKENWNKKPRPGRFI